MAEFKYKARIADAALAKKLKSSGAVLVEGPKWCGKTTTSEQQAKSINYVSDPMNLGRNQTDALVGSPSELPTLGISLTLPLPLLLWV